MLIYVIIKSFKLEFVGKGAIMKQKDVDTLIEIIFYIITLPIRGIMWLVNSIRKKSTSDKNKKLIEEKIKSLTLYRADILNWNLNGYISKIKSKCINQNGSSTIQFKDENFCFHDEKGNLCFIHYKNVSSSQIYSSVDCNNLIIQIENSKIPFSIHKLNDAEEFYKIISNIIEINKKIGQSDTNKILMSNNALSSFEKTIELIKKKQYIINGFVDKYIADISTLIERLGVNVFRFDGALYYQLAGNNVSQYFVSEDGFHSYYHVMDENIEEVIFFANGLKKRLQGDWENKISLDTVVYIVIRNSIVKYYAKYFKLNYEGSISDSLLEQKDNELIIYKMAYVCNHLLENDISLPLYTTYVELSRKINQQLDDTRRQRKEAELFINSEKFNGKTANTMVNDKKITGIDYIDQLTGEEFEKFIGDYFKSKGYKVVVTPLSGDFGVDIIVENELVKIGIQAKRYSDRVTNAAVQEIVAGIKHYNLDKGMVITNNYFTKAAKELAKDNNIVLWDRDTLKEKVLKG